MRIGAVGDLSLVRPTVVKVSLRTLPVLPVLKDSERRGDRWLVRKARVFILTRTDLIGISPARLGPPVCQVFPQDLLNLRSYKTLFCTSIDCEPSKIRLTRFSMAL